MASITIQQLPWLVTAANTESTEIKFSEELKALGIGNAGVNIAYIQVVSGTFNFSNFGTASSLNGDFTDGSKIPLTFGNGKSISFKAANIGETFIISV